ncbi:hypothetical protein PInf_019119 [Phytophthora infestans]|nr:hypothetical protein PInf_019119 [Phytophthora infestans]
MVPETTAIADATEVEADHETAVTEVVADMILSVETALPAQHAEKRKRSTQVPTRERRRALLQEDIDGDDDTSRQRDEDESAYEADVVHSVPACIIDTYPNFMDEGADECKGLNSYEDPELREEPEDEEDADDDSWDGADECKGLNSYEDPELREEPEDEEDADDDSWDGDWDIGELTDEDSNHEQKELPKTAWLSTAKNAPLITALRTDGWEYDSNSVVVARQKILLKSDGG